MEHYGALWSTDGALWSTDGAADGALWSTDGTLEQLRSTDGALGAAMEH
jgi:hypothetical protein